MFLMLMMLVTNDGNGDVYEGHGEDVDHLISIMSTSLKGL